MTYVTSIGANYADDTSITTVKQFYNAYLMHKLYVKHLIDHLPTDDSTNDGLNKLLNILEYNVKNLAQLVRVQVYTMCS